MYPVYHHLFAERVSAEKGIFEITVVRQTPPSGLQWRFKERKQVTLKAALYRLVTSVSRIGVEPSVRIHRKFSVRIPITSEASELMKYSISME